MQGPTRLPSLVSTISYLLRFHHNFTVESTTCLTRPFHLGVRYLLYAAAVLTKFRPVFYRTYKKQLDFLVADIAAMGGGAMAKHFPIARQKVRRMMPCCTAVSFEFEAIDARSRGTDRDGCVSFFFVSIGPPSCVLCLSSFVFLSAFLGCLSGWSFCVDTVFRPCLGLSPKAS